MNQKEPKTQTGKIDLPVVWCRAAHSTWFICVSLRCNWQVSQSWGECLWAAEGDFHENWNLECSFSSGIAHVNQCCHFHLLYALVSHEWFQSLCGGTTDPGHSYPPRTVPQYNLLLNVYPGRKEYTELGGQEEMGKCHFGCMQVRLFLQVRLLAEREWNKKRAAWANCFYFQNMSNLVKKLEKLSCETASLGSSMPQKKTLIFLCKLPCWWIFFIAWACAGTLHCRQLFPKAWCLLQIGGHPSCSVWEIMRSL